MERVYLIQRAIYMDELLCKAELIINEAIFTAYKSKEAAEKVLTDHGYSRNRYNEWVVAGDIESPTYNIISYIIQE